MDVEAHRSFVIEPNASMSWRNLLVLYGLISFVTLFIGVFLFVQGLKLVLPFSGLDVAALGIALYVTARRSFIREVITFTKGKVAVQIGHGKPEAIYEFTGPWTKVVLQTQKDGWYPSKLFIRSRDAQVEIGKFLNEYERLDLAKELKKTISHFV